MNVNLKNDIIGIGMQQIERRKFIYSMESLHKENSEEENMNYLNLKNKFEEKKECLVFTKEEVEQLLIEKFNAEEFSFEQMLDLKNYDFFEYDKIYKAYTIKYKCILKGLFNEEEKDSHNQAESYEDLDTYSKLEEYIVCNDIIKNQQIGKRVDVILESKDGKYISKFEVRDQCEKMDRFLNSLVVGSHIQLKEAYGDKLYNLDESQLNDIGLTLEDRDYICKDLACDINNEYYTFYLENLYIFGLI